MSPSVREAVRAFVFPRVTKKFIARVLIVAAVAYMFFGHLCLPLRMDGCSMEPTYHDGGVAFCWRLSYAFSQPDRHDVVVIRMAGPSVMLLKRVVAFEGETVEFREGRLLVNGEVLAEPYVQGPCDWNLESVQVRQGNVYVVGDNRAVSSDVHMFGQTALNRVMGAPIW